MTKNYQTWHDKPSRKRFDFHRVDHPPHGSYIYTYMGPKEAGTVKFAGNTV